MKTETLVRELEAIYQEILSLEPRADLRSGVVDPEYRLSAKNLLRYLILRNHDLRKLHDPLSDLGISSLRSAEGYVLSNLHHVLHLLHLLKKEPWPESPPGETIGYGQSKKLLQAHSNLLFHREASYTQREIMVTMPEQAATDPELIRNMAECGMTIARINLSQGEEPLWQAMVDNIREASRDTGKDIKIYMDLAGPKIRIHFPEARMGKPVKSIPIAVGRLLELRKGPVDVEQFERAVKGGGASTAIPLQVSIPEVVDALGVGEQVFFDDGVIRSRVVGKTASSATVQIEKAFARKLRQAKGMNIPDTALKLPSLTLRDLETLPFMAEQADLVGYSFVTCESDVTELYERLESLGKTKPGVIFKIENQRAFDRLPLILLEGMKHHRIGVMIARGDLAVEIGFDRISEVQNEILWLCEAAHVPVIWATQVLDTLAKKGIATRAEISDAALSVRSECVMLNKGPFILDAISELSTILGRMESHSSKNKNALRPLRIARKNLEFLQGTPMED